MLVGGAPLMVSDAHPGQSAGATATVHVSLDFTDVGEMTQKFTALAEGGTITVPLQDTFWGAKFGMLTDLFGLRWMFNCEAKKL